MDLAASTDTSPCRCQKTRGQVAVDTDQCRHDLRAHALRSTNHDPRTTNHEPRTTNPEPRITNHESRTTNNEPRARYPRHQEQLPRTHATDHRLAAARLSSPSAVAPLFGAVSERWPESVRSRACIRWSDLAGWGDSRRSRSPPPHPAHHHRRHRPWRGAPRAGVSAGRGPTQPDGSSSARTRVRRVRDPRGHPVRRPHVPGAAERGRDGSGRLVVRGSVRALHVAGEARYVWTVAPREPFALRRQGTPDPARTEGRALAGARVSRCRNGRNEQAGDQRGDGRQRTQAHEDPSKAWSR